MLEEVGADAALRSSSKGFGQHFSLLHPRLPLRRCTMALKCTYLVQIDARRKPLCAVEKLSHQFGKLLGECQHAITNFVLL